MNTNVVQTLWIDPVLGDHQKQCLQSFLDKGCQVHLYSYEPVKNTPVGVHFKNANEILDKKFIFKDLHNSYATFSDWFRIKLLYDQGGWWVDADMLCIKPFDIEWPYVFASEVECTPEGEITHICNCIIKMPKGSAMGKSLLDRISETISLTEPTKIAWTAIGARYMTSEIVKRELLDYVVSPKVFCPFDYTSYQQIFTDTNFQLDEITYGVHLWNKMWEWSQKEPLKEMKKISFFSTYIK